ncbi:type IV pilus twitching motility protein PilT [Sedimentibacter hydroxybenzoicus DSM 7310]|uniref:Type IV pilus twitching motility protein PilT n=1 Tax=Sedimentibacter hydroxybenzoicus DSM 7310 TaxID=1123245 RepID=A0A974GWI0_SEDHY|nr:type IV pilus twitching motility protein PilT [Sedimentibacter hydroxybenzoicus]NYB74301.1 type IV pilus twitching motility protein PilT [Sedimentibacter hydroxybenzoicus DSM 7310]
MNINDMLCKLIEMNGSDLHITVGCAPIYRINGVLINTGTEKLTPDDTESLVRQVTSEEQLKEINDIGDFDMSYAIQSLGRFRINIFKQRGSYSIAIRAVRMEIPTLKEINMPEILYDFTQRQRGLILVTGPTGSGKSTTLASMINIINSERKHHIITLEDPIEYLHKHNKSIVNQREYRSDFKSFASGLRSCMRQDPDVILLGEMRDLETMEMALTAAETGHLVFSTLHTTGAAKTIDRIIDVFPPHQQQQVTIQLANVLEGVISQQLVLNMDEKERLAAVEIMVTTPAIRNLIREKKTHQIQNQIQTGSKFGMQTMDFSLLNLYNEKKISRQTLLKSAIDLDYVMKQI